MLRPCRKVVGARGRHKRLNRRDGQLNTNDCGYHVIPPVLDVGYVVGRTNGESYAALQLRTEPTAEFNGLALGCVLYCHGCTLGAGTIQQ
jgi:hypothetical protein